MLGRKKSLLSALGRPLPDNFQTDLVDKRNDAVHEGAEISRAEARDAIAAALSVVEEAFPLPTPPGSAEPIRRRWEAVPSSTLGNMVIRRR
jgi:hypothetical protein